MEGPPAEVIEGGSAELCWRYRVRRAPERLRPFVRQMIAYEERTSGLVERRELPLAGLVIILELEPAIAVEVEGELRQFGSGFLAGIGGLPSRTIYRRAQRGVQIDVTPLGARALFGQSGAALEGRAVEMNDLGAGELVERLREAPDWECRFHILDAFFERRLAAFRGDLRLSRWLYEAIDEGGGNRPIAELVRESGYSHGYLGRFCRRELGLTPKRLSQLVRFRRLAERLQTGEVASLARLARELGYADQSHLVRETRSWAGVPPSKLLALTTPRVEP